MNLNQKTFLILGGWIAYVTLTYIYYEQIANTIMTSGLLLGIILYLFMNPAYLVLIYSIFEFGKMRGRVLWKRVLASILIILGFDFTAVPRLSLNDGLLNGGVIATNIGSIVMRALESFLPHTIAYFTMYWVLPLVLIATSLELLGVTDFIREIKRR